MEHPIKNGGSFEEEMEGESIKSGSENASNHEIEDSNSSNEELAARTVLEGDLHLLKYDKIKIARNITVLRKIADRNRTVMRKRMVLITKKGARAVIDILNVANKYHVIPKRT